MAWKMQTMETQKVAMVTWCMMALSEEPVCRLRNRLNPFYLLVFHRSMVFVGAFSLLLSLLKRFQWLGPDWIFRLNIFLEGISIAPMSSCSSPLFPVTCVVALSINPSLVAGGDGFVGMIRLTNPLGSLVEVVLEVRVSASLDIENLNAPEGKLMVMV
ncbi:hypothetical protein SUGI_0138460 [Cryptomeria japonica]|nr:hypothetical protein SUGI_0138460 [Cryptomeria japonica]